MNQGLESFKIYKQEKGSEIVFLVPRVITRSNGINARIITRLKKQNKKTLMVRAILLRTDFPREVVEEVLLLSLK